MAAYWQCTSSVRCSSAFLRTMLRHSAAQPRSHGDDSARQRVCGQRRHHSLTANRPDEVRAGNTSLPRTGHWPVALNNVQRRFSAGFPRPYARGVAQILLPRPFLSLRYCGSSFGQSVGRRPEGRRFNSCLLSPTIIQGGQPDHKVRQSVVWGSSSIGRAAGKAATPSQKLPRHSLDRGVCGSSFDS